ncbi:MAG: hypothetical protein KC464_23295 [Myxococcales bacterium]|nr:hypothetical protein [Myxococcales bacterium]
MRTNLNRTLLAVLLTALVGTLAGCPGGPGIPGRGGSKVDPNTCGNYAATDAGRKLKAFLEATVTLQDAVKGVEVEVKTGCDAMATELGMGEQKGSTKEVCDKVIAQLKEDLHAGITAEAHLNVDYKPAVCTVDVQAAASFAAQCEAKAEADVSVTCEGTCSGTCNGACDGTCSGDNSGGECNGQCDGQCNGSCSGGCEGEAHVDASAECKAKAEVSASAKVECTPAELNVDADASVVVDKPRYDRAIAAIKAGLPKILTVQAKLKPLGAAVKTWVKTAQDLGAAGKDLASSFKDQALCISGQISAAVAAVANIQASVDVSVEVSVSASASAGVGG